MATLHRSIGRPRSHATLLAGLLVCTLALATMLAYAAHDATRSHRATAERALHDYAAVAAWELVTGVNDELQSALNGALAPVTRARASSPYELLASPGVFSANAKNALRCPTSSGDTSRFYFRVDFRDASLATVGAAPTPAMRTWLADTVVSHGRGLYKPNWNYAIVLGGPRGEQRSAVVYAVKYAEHGAPIAAYGFRTCDAVLGATMLQGVAARHALLPASVSSGVANDSVVSITVRDLEGRTIYQSPNAQTSVYAADAPFEQAGALIAHVAIRPRAVPLLALGAIPESRVPWLVGLLTLTAAMAALTILQLRREQELSRLRADFISSVSHELRTPLSQILLFAETLNLGRVRTEEERLAATNVIVQEGRRLMHLVENVLHFSRAERRMSRLGPEPLDLTRAIASILDDWLPLAVAAEVRVETRFAPDIHAVADRSALRQILLNLLDNAVKYGPVGQTVTVGAALVDSQSGARVRLWVDDEGEGIPPSERERVWRSFYRLDRHANSSTAGSGIGLFVVRELVHLHGGDAWVEDAPSGGTRVVLELPAATYGGSSDEHSSITAMARRVQRLESHS